MNRPQSTENVIDMQSCEPPIELPDGITQADLQRVTGLDRSTISRGVRGQLRTGSEAYARILQAVADLGGATATGPGEPAPKAALAKPNSPQSGGQTLLAAFLKISETRNAFSVVTGPSGVGKTYILNRFLDEVVKPGAKSDAKETR